MAAAAAPLALAFTTLWAAGSAVGAGIARGYQLPPVPREDIVASVSAWLISALVFTFVRAGRLAMLVTAIPVTIVLIGQQLAFEGDLTPFYGFAPACVIVLCLGAMMRAARLRGAGRWLVVCGGVLVAHSTWVMGWSTFELLRGDAAQPEIAALLLDGSCVLGVLAPPSLAMLLVVDAAHAVRFHRQDRRRSMETQG